MIVEFGEGRRVALVPRAAGGGGGDPATESARVALAVLDGAASVEVDDPASATRAAVSMAVLLSVHRERHRAEESPVAERPAR